MVESTALEMRHTGNCIGGSNPSLSAIIDSKMLKYSDFRAGPAPELCWDAVRRCEAFGVAAKVAELEKPLSKRDEI